MENLNLNFMFFYAKNLEYINMIEIQNKGSGFEEQENQASRNLSKILKQLIKTCNEIDISPDDNCLFENATKIYLSDKIQGFKESNMKTISASKEILNPIVNKQEFKDQYKATEKQIELLKKLKYSGTKELSKIEATNLIKELLGGKNEQTKGFKE